MRNKEEIKNAVNEISYIIAEIKTGKKGEYIAIYNPKRQYGGAIYWEGENLVFSQYYAGARVIIGSIGIKDMREKLAGINLKLSVK